MAQPPDVTQFTIFVRNVMRIGSNYLPDGSPYFGWTFDHSFDEVNDLLSVAMSSLNSWSPYELAVYNLAGHLLIEYAQDVSYEIAGVTWAAGMVTIETATVHSILPGDKITIAGVSPLPYSGTPGVGYVIVQAVPDTTHFSYSLPLDPGAANLLPGASATEYYFVDLRKQLKINSFVPGVVSNTSDLTTSVGLVVPDFFKTLTLEQMDLMKTPFGRAYLMIAQKYGPTVWGLTR